MSDLDRLTDAEREAFREFDEAYPEPLDWTPEIRHELDLLAGEIGDAEWFFEDLIGPEATIQVPKAREGRKAWLNAKGDLSVAQNLLKRGDAAGAALHALQARRWLSQVGNVKLARGRPGRPGAPRKPMTESRDLRFYRIAKKIQDEEVISTARACKRAIVRYPEISAGFRSTSDTALKKAWQRGRRQALALGET